MTSITLSFSSAPPQRSGRVGAKFLFFADSKDLRFLVLALTPPPLGLCFSMSGEVRLW